MPKHPQEPHLYTVSVDGDTVAVIRAMSQPEAREYWLGAHVVIERPTPIQAYRVGSLLGIPVEPAKPEYEDEGPQIPLLVNNSARPEGDA